MERDGVQAEPEIAVVTERRDVADVDAGVMEALRLWVGLWDEMDANGEGLEAGLAPVPRPVVVPL